MRCQQQYLIIVRQKFKLIQKRRIKMKNKGTWICILFILAGLVIGGLIGQLASGVDFLWWLSYGQ